MTTMRQIDWAKVLLLILVVVCGGYVAKSKLDVAFSGLDGDSPAAIVSIPEPNDDAKLAVQPLSDIRSINTRAADTLSEYLAAYAWVIENSAQRDTWSSNVIAINIQMGAGHLEKLKLEVGMLSGSGVALNESLDNLWGEKARQLTSKEAASGIYACAWALAGER